MFLALASTVFSPFFYFSDVNVALLINNSRYIRLVRSDSDMQYAIFISNVFLLTVFLLTVLYAVCPVSTGTSEREKGKGGGELLLKGIDKILTQPDSQVLHLRYPRYGEDPDTGWSRGTQILGA